MGGAVGGALTECCLLLHQCLPEQPAALADVRVALVCNGRRASQPPHRDQVHGRVRHPVGDADSPLLACCLAQDRCSARPVC
eukprot:2885467-Rhodomonas_salina.1